MFLIGMKAQSITSDLVDKKESSKRICYTCVNCGATFYMQESKVNEKCSSNGLQQNHKILCPKCSGHISTPDCKGYEHFRCIICGKNFEARRVCKDLACSSTTSNGNFICSECLSRRNEGGFYIEEDKP